MRVTGTEASNTSIATAHPTAKNQLSVFIPTMAAQKSPATMGYASTTIANAVGTDFENGRPNRMLEASAWIIEPKITHTGCLIRSFSA